MQMGLGLCDNDVAAGGVLPDTDHGTVQHGKLRVGKNQDRRPRSAGTERGAGRLQEA